MHRACLAKEYSGNEVDVRIFQVTEVGNGYAYLDYSYGDLDAEKTRKRSPLMSLEEAVALFFQHVQALCADDYIEIDETDYTTYQMTHEMAPGAVILGRYRIEGLLGSGGQGKVYLATDIQMDGSLVALKVLKQSGLSVEERFEAERRFAQEKAILSNLRLKHNAIPVIYDFKFIGDVPVMSMQYIAGESLQQKLDSPFPCPLEKACEIVLQLCDVLGFLHSQTPPIIYRDLKPSNVMIDRSWHQLYLIDFGIARFFDKTKKHDTVAMGSPGYTSPELLAGKQTTPRSDIYSLGALFHHLVSGEDPGNAPLFHFSSTHKKCPDLSRSLDAIITKMTAKEPKDRYESMEEVAQAIEKLKKRAETKTVRAPEKKPTTGTVFLVSASLLSDRLAEDQAAALELHRAIYRPLRAAGYGLWGKIYGDPQQAQETFLLQLQQATHLLLSVTPDLLQTPEGLWITEQVLKARGKPVLLAPMRTCQPTGPLARRRLLLPTFIDATTSSQERKKRLDAIASAIMRRVVQEEKIPA